MNGPNPLHNITEPSVDEDWLKLRTNFTANDQLMSALRVGHAHVPIAPYISISIEGTVDQPLNREELVRYFKSVVMGNESSDQNTADWSKFAESNQLMAGDVPFVKPHEWIRGEKRWMTINWPSNWELHVHFGFLSQPGSKHTHLELVRDTNKWLSKVSRKACKHRFKINKPKVTGDARVASYESGIEVTHRQSLDKSIFCLQTLTTASTFIVAFTAYAIKNFQMPTSLEDWFKVATVAFVILIVLPVIFAVARHYILIPKYTWGVPGLKD